HKLSTQANDCTTYFGTCPHEDHCFQVARLRRFGENWPFPPLFDSSDSIRTCTSVSPNPNRDTPKAPESGLQYTGERTFAVPSTSAEKEIRTYYGTLYRAWGGQHWWPAETPFEVIVGAYLTQNTAWINGERALANLRNAGE